MVVKYWDPWMVIVGSAQKMFNIMVWGGILVTELFNGIFSNDFGCFRVTSRLKGRQCGL